MSEYNFTISLYRDKRKLSELYLQTNYLFKFIKWIKANTSYQANIFSYQVNTLFLLLAEKMYKHDLFKVNVRLRIFSSSL